MFFDGVSAELRPSSVYRGSTAHKVVIMGLASVLVQAASPLSPSIDVEVELKVEVKVKSLSLLMHEQFWKQQQRQIVWFCAREYWWGLEPGVIDIDSHLNRVSVRGDIERLLSVKALTLVPTKEIVDTMLELTLYNQKHSVSERRRCFDALPDQDYQYRLVPGSGMKDRIPLFAFDSSSGTFERFDYPYDNLPLFTLSCYPFHSIMHSDFALSRSRPIHDTFLAIFKLSSRWASHYPHVGSFVTSPRVAAIIAADAAADNGDDPYSDLDSTSGATLERMTIWYPIQIQILRINKQLLAESRYPKDASTQEKARKLPPA
ncbi:hypothetical protein BT96DRAFT_1007368 [Gymnopus androsaceus JB14]|uniref:Uncharacterized protein n=1 Tax=Gymnopus androsaceus JB14 TaxID=1447944 RepID=A0A6A4GHT9_9AGAR|nr:hypothetical protein BT96DRAFT_1007368 [Gymnopus androsaceus JB14]